MQCVRGENSLLPDSRDVLSPTFGGIAAIAFKDCGIAAVEI
jgi:hypothetical protein